MSTLNPGQAERRELGGDLSKRERMKLEMAMRREDSLQNQEIRHPKRRGHSSHRHNEPHRRKEVKIDHNPPRNPPDQLYSSPVNSSEPLSTTPPNLSHPAQTLPNHLNPRYALPEGDSSIFNYLLHYTYVEGEKRLEKESQDWSALDGLDFAPLTVTSHPASIALAQKLNAKVREVKDKLREPLGKTHRELSQKFFKKNSSIPTLHYHPSIHQHTPGHSKPDTSTTTLKNRAYREIKTAEAQQACARMETLKVGLCGKQEIMKRMRLRRHQSQEKLKFYTILHLHSAYVHQTMMSMNFKHSHLQKFIMNRSQ